MVVSSYVLGNNFFGVYSLLCKCRSSGGSSDLADMFVRHGLLIMPDLFMSSKNTDYACKALGKHVGDWMESSTIH